VAHDGLPMNAALTAAATPICEPPLGHDVDQERISVARLTLTDFRSYATGRIESDGSSCILTGPNGAGKTNVLEALSFLAPGRGLRRAKTAEVGRRDLTIGAAGRSWAVAARLQGPRGPIDIGTGTRGNDSDAQSVERRRVRIDGDDVGQQSALADHLALSWLTPQMDRLFLEGPTARRRFLDRLVFTFDPAHAGRVSAYEHALRERMRVLQSGRTEPAWLDALEATIAEKGVAVSAARSTMAQNLNQVCQATEGPFPSASVECQGQVETWLADGPALGAEDQVRAALFANRTSDAATGRATFAPHRCDLLVSYSAKQQPADACSTGEQKALLISLVLAHADLVRRTTGTAPILLLDEVAAHLDEDRRHALFNQLIGLGGQFWLTGTDASQFKPIADHTAHFTVSNGDIRPL